MFSHYVVWTTVRILVNHSSCWVLCHGDHGHHQSQQCPWLSCSLESRLKQIHYSSAYYRLDTWLICHLEARCMAYLYSRKQIISSFAHKRPDLWFFCPLETSSMGSSADKRSDPWLICPSTVSRAQCLL